MYIHYTFMKWSSFCTISECVQNVQQKYIQVCSICVVDFIREMFSVVNFTPDTSAEHDAVPETDMVLLRSIMTDIHFDISVVVECGCIL